MNITSQKYKSHTNSPNFVGYPLFYVVNDAKCWCSDCRNDELDHDDVVTSHDVNYDDKNLWCDNCSTQIECAYNNEENEVVEND